jgi:hypothetical protein
LYGAGEDLALLEELLDVVFAEMGLRGIGGLVEGEDVVCGFEFRYGYEADLGRVRDVGWVFGRLERFGEDVPVSRLCSRR